MKKLTFRIIFLILPFFIVNILYLIFDVQLEKFELTKFKNVTQGIDVANLGSSHGSSFLYDIDEFQNSECFNFAIAQQTLDYDYAILRQYIDNFKKNSTLIISLSSFETNGVPDEGLTWSSRQRYYSFLDSKYIESVSYSDWFCFNYLPLLKTKNLVNDWKVIKNKIYGSFSHNKLMSINPSVLNIEADSESEYSMFSDEEKNQKGEKAIQFFAELFPPSEEGKFFNIKYIDFIIKLCNEHQINSVVVTTPITRSAYDYISKNSVYYDIYKFHSELAERYPDTKFLNYIDLYFDQDNLFCDSTHLNHEGRIRFSKLIYSDLVKFGFIN